MRVLAAPDSFKGSVSALGVAQAMSRGVRKVFPEAVVELLPVADGGEGTVETLVEATGGRLRSIEVSGPLGEPVSAQWGELDGGRAVMEMAASSGLTLLPEGCKDPLRATTFGVGQQVKAVLDAGLTTLILGIGGSATNDGGSGFAHALGARFLDSRGHELAPGGAALAQLEHIDLSGLDPRLEHLEILVACDVDNPLCGPRGASAVFGPQKGATHEMVRELDAALARYAEVAEAACGRMVRDIPGSGAAGGLGAALQLFTKARLRPGVEIVMEAMHFSDKLPGAAFVLTGEGNTDFQTVFGKAPVGVARLAKQHGVPVICISGGLGRDYSKVYDAGIDAALGCPAGPMSLRECMERGAALAEAATERACRLIRVGMNLEKA